MRQPLGRQSAMYWPCWSDLSMSWLATASSAYSGALLQAVDIHNRTVTFSHNGSSTKVNYDLLIGADGVNSKVRCASPSADCSS